jgi:hypothetical protein
MLKAYVSQEVVVQAAIRAGCIVNTAKVQGSQLVKTLKMHLRLELNLSASSDLVPAAHLTAGHKVSEAHIMPDVMVSAPTA